MGTNAQMRWYDKQWILCQMQISEIEGLLAVVSRDFGKKQMAQKTRLALPPNCAGMPKSGMG